MKSAIEWFLMRKTPASHDKLSSVTRIPCDMLMLPINFAIYTSRDRSNGAKPLSQQFQHSSKGQSSCQHVNTQKRHYLAHHLSHACRYSQVSISTLSATGHATLFATEKNRPSLGIFSFTFSVPAARLIDISKSTFDLCPLGRFAAIYEFGPNLGAVANNVVARVADNLAQDPPSRI